MADTAELFDEDHDKRGMFLIGFAGLFLGVPAVRARVLEAFLARATEPRPRARRTPRATALRSGFAGRSALASASTGVRSSGARRSP